MNQFTLDLGKPTVGSSGTVTNGARILYNSSAVIANGTITVTDPACKMAVANYGTLTLDGVTASPAVASVLYMINNRGALMLKNGTSVTGGTDYTITMDPYDLYCDNGYPATLTVNDQNVTVGSVQLEVGKDNGNNADGSINLYITNGTFEKIDVLEPAGSDDATISVLGYISNAAIIKSVSDEEVLALMQRFNDGSDSNGLKANVPAYSAPKTGDSTNFVLLIALMVMSGAVLTIAARKKALGK